MIVKMQFTIAYHPVVDAPREKSLGAFDAK